MNTARPAQAGLAYVEVLVATLLVGLALVPALEALSSGVRSAGAGSDALRAAHELHAEMERLLAEPFAALESAAAAAGDAGTPTGYSRDVVRAGAPTLHFDVYLAPYDGDNADADDDPFTGGDAGLLWLRVELAGSRHALETLVAR